VMMLDINLDVLRRDFRRFVPMATLVGAIIVIETALILWRGYGATTTPVHEATPAGGAVMSNTFVIGKVIYTDYVFAFEIAGLVLLVAIIAAIALTARKGKDSKRQRVSEQVKVRAKDRVRLVKMPAEKVLETGTDAQAPGEAGADVGAGAVGNNR
jgi:NADH-quinone oxidoreductase subunit J